MTRGAFHESITFSLAFAPKKPFDFKASPREKKFRGIRSVTTVTTVIFHIGTGYSHRGWLPAQGISPVVERETPIRKVPGSILTKFGVFFLRCQGWRHGEAHPCEPRPFHLHILERPKLWCLSTSICYQISLTNIIVCTFQSYNRRWEINLQAISI